MVSMFELLIIFVQLALIALILVFYIKDKSPIDLIICFLMILLLNQNLRDVEIDKIKESLKETSTISSELDSN